MIIDARRLDADSPVECDVCVIGAGPAGITVALELEASGAQICIVEAGGRAFEPASQALFDGEIEEDPHRRLRDTRLAALGGSTGLWSGWCRPLDPIDFERREGMEWSGWPFGLEEIEPHYERAHELLGLGGYEYDPLVWEQRLGTRRLPVSNDDLETIVFQVSPVRFGTRYLNRLQRSPNIRLVLHAVAQRFYGSPADDRVSRVGVATTQGHAMNVTAREFVLAAGGVENARLLLLSGDSPVRSLGNSHGLVGRYYADHSFLNAGTLVMDDAVRSLDFYFPGTSPETPEGSSVRGAFSLSRRALEREGLMNSVVFFRPAYEAHPAFDTSEVRAMLELWEKVRGRGVSGHALPWLRRALRRPGALTVALWRRLTVNNRGARRWPLRASLDCTPRRENAVLLSEAVDAFGRPLPRVRWSLGDLELKSVRHAYEVLDSAFRSSGVGRLEIPLSEENEAWRQACESGKHHNMGTTRMHQDPSSGVVDAEATVHGTPNLHVAGSSVFPTFGFANPTLTIVALSVRLGRRLRTRLEARR